jgi:hypothetical protein
MRPCMSNKEIELFNKYLNTFHIYVEFGSGGSTYLASVNTNIKYICTIESCLMWIDKVKEQESVQTRLAQQQIEFIHVDTGANPHNWGFPSNQNKKENWPLYSAAILKSNIYTTSDKILVLIDGRFRVACAAQSACVVKPDSVICIHDYMNRSHYHVVDKFLEMIESIDTMAIFKRRANINNEEIMKIYESYKFDYR